MEFLGRERNSGKKRGGQIPGRCRARFDVYIWGEAMLKQKGIDSFKINKDQS